jgi:hypothetical protein
MTPAQKRTSTKPKATKKPGQKLKATSKEMLLSIIVQMSALHGGKAPVELVARTGGYGNAKTPAFKMALKRAATRGHLVVHRTAPSPLRTAVTGRPNRAAWSCQRPIGRPTTRSRMST